VNRKEYQMGKRGCHKTEKGGWYMSRMIVALEIGAP